MIADGFMPLSQQRNCCIQVLALTLLVENGFQKGLKTSLTFVDLSVAYYIVWFKGLALKMMRTIHKYDLPVKNILTNRYFRDTLTESKIKESEKTLTKNFSLLHNYYKRWR